MIRSRRPEWVEAAILAAEANGHSPFPPPEPPPGPPPHDPRIHFPENRYGRSKREWEVEERARYEAKVQRALPIIQAVCELAEVNHLSEAYRLVRADLVRHPEYFLSYALQLTLTSLLAERYDEAEAICRRYLEIDGRPIKSFVELSLAIAEQGRLYAGQAEYSGRALRQAYGGSPLEGRLGPKWIKPQGAEAVAIACRLALGNTWSHPWRYPLLERVLEREPSCEVAAILLADGYHAESRQTDALRVLDIAIEHASRGAGRDELISIRDKEARGLHWPTVRAYQPTSSLMDLYFKVD